MKKFLAFSVVCFVTYSLFAQTVTMHHIGVGQGDATLILLDNGAGDTASILIDAGNSKSKGDAVLTVLDKYLSNRKSVDFIIVSHLHSDHMGGMPEVLTQLKNANWSVGYILDRAANDANNGDADLCYDGVYFTSNDGQPPIPSTQLVKSYRTAVTATTRKGWLNLAAGVDLVSLWLGKTFSMFTFRCVTSNAYVCKTVTDYSDWSNLSGSAHNENDYSYAFLLEMGSFKYFTGGDIGGASPYLDVETPLVSFFQTRSDASTFHFCAYKASHHGSLNSTNTTFVNYVKPTVTIVPSALRSFNGTQLPGQQTLTRIAASSTNNTQFYTYIWNTNSTPYSGTVSSYKDVILKVNGTTYESNHTMNITTYNRDKTSLAIDSSSVSNSTFQCTKH